MREFKLYTDGSHFKDEPGGRLGIGSVLVGKGGNVIDYMSEEVDRLTIKELYRTGDVSNPTMEMYSVLVSLRKFSKRLEFNDKVEIYSDYEGVLNWMTNKWKINKEYIYMIKEDILNEILSQKLQVTFNWIKGHDNNVYNELADKLAKGEIKKV